ncbi:MAG: GGDEF domain-containing protein [Desulfobacteraceae bacterium]|nr:GGDEF domain-containing protein [Desulfobacteraceae bacterium]MBC2758032.1 GGDEF domain-containing protein [Desulfobacteraceae bacterium]
MIYGIIYGILVAFIVYFATLAIMKQSRKYREYAYKDNLTGIANRRLFDQAIVVEWNRNLRKQLSLSVIMADIDNFKAYNDTYGHTQGDECLKAIARVFDKYLQRAGDLTARYGGEEFIAVLPDTLASEASFLAEKIREAVETLAIKHETSDTGKILTISLGTCTMVPNAGINPADLILKADDALFQAKNNGRNRVVSIDKA